MSPTRYRLSSQEAGSTAAEPVAWAWGIENRVHWVMDVTFDEDLRYVPVQHHKSRQPYAI